jgi:acetyl esterase
MPRALLIQADCDVLFSEGEAYGERLEAAGVEVTRKLYTQTLHGFLSSVGYLEEAIDTPETIASYLQQHSI